MTATIARRAFIAGLGGEPRGGLVVLTAGFPFSAPIISAAARNNVPAVYIASNFVRDGAPPMESRV
jgi:hypothetical protein